MAARRRPVYRLGRVEPRPGWFHQAELTREADGWRLVFSDGHVTDFAAEVCDAREAQARHRDELEALGASWILPLLERMARGERVHVNTLHAACRHATGASVPVVGRRGGS